MLTSKLILLIVVKRFNDNQGRNQDFGSGKTSDKIFSEVARISFQNGDIQQKLTQIYNLKKFKQNFQQNLKNILNFV